MKPQDILVIIALTELKNGVASFRQLSDRTLLSVSQCFDGVERLYECGLVSSDRRVLNVAQLRTFFLFALPYLFPGKLKAHGKGISIVSTLPIMSSALSDASNNNWVWPAQDKKDFGIQIDPLTENIVECLNVRPEWQPILAAIEILRFPQHSHRAGAAEKIQSWLSTESLPINGLSTSSSITSKSILDAQDCIEKAAQMISVSGYRSFSLERLTQFTHLSEAELRQLIGEPEQIFATIGRQSVAKANAHLGKAILANAADATTELKESLDSFLKFVDSNEEYFRLGLWFYLELLPSNGGEKGVLGDGFFEHLMNLHQSINSSVNAEARSVVFASAWVSYAWFRWFEYPRLTNRQLADNLLVSYRNFLTSAASGSF